MTAKILPKTKAPKKSLDVFRASHDKSIIVPKKIADCFAAMAKAGDAFEYEGDFVKRAGLSQAELGTFRDQYTAHIVRTSGKNAKNVWFHDVKTAAEALEAIS